MNNEQIGTNQNTSEVIKNNEVVASVKVPVSAEEEQVKAEAKVKNEIENNKNIEELRNKISQQFENSEFSDSFINKLNLKKDEIINLTTGGGSKTGEVMVVEVAPYYKDKGDNKSVLAVNGFIKTLSGYNEPVRIIPDGNGKYNVISSKDNTVLRNSAEISR